MSQARKNVIQDYVIWIKASTIISSANNGSPIVTKEIKLTWKVVCDPNKSYVITEGAYLPGLSNT